MMLMLVLRNTVGNFFVTATRHRKGQSLNASLRSTVAFRWLGLLREAATARKGAMVGKRTERLGATTNQIGAGEQARNLVVVVVAQDVGLGEEQMRSTLGYAGEGVRTGGAFLTGSG